MGSVVPPGILGGGGEGGGRVLLPPVSCRSGGDYAVSGNGNYAAN